MLIEKHDDEKKLAKKIKAVVLMTRFYTTHPYIATVVSAALLAGNFDFTKIALMCLSVCSVLFFVNVTNFYTDAKQDELHPMTRSENAFTNKVLDKKDMITMSLLYVAVSMLAAIPLGVYWILAVASYNFIAFIYDFKPFRMKSKPYGWFLDASLSLPLTFLFPYLVSSSTPVIPSWIIVAVIMFYTIFAMVVSKDIPDMIADKSANDRTFPNVYGLKMTRRLLIVLSFVSLACFSALTLMGVISMYSLPLMALLTLWILRNVVAEHRLKDRISVYLKLNVLGIMFMPVIFMFGVVAKIFFML